MSLMREVGGMRQTVPQRTPRRKYVVQVSKQQELNFNDAFLHGRLFPQSNLKHTSRNVSCYITMLGTIQKVLLAAIQDKLPLSLDG